MYDNLVTFALNSPILGIEIIGRASGVFKDASINSNEYDTFYRFKIQTSFKTDES